MNGDFISLTNDALWLVLILSAPPIIVASVAGLLVAIVQAATQIQEQTLAFVFKAAGLVACVIVAGPWMLGQIVTWTEQLYTSIPTMVGG
jgi:type III secretion protein S